jgi:RHS repeat-associated protein
MNFAEKSSHVTLGTTEAYYNYDGSGESVRKVVEKNGVVETRLYLGGLEIFRKKVGNSLELERETLHIMDDKRRIAVVETKTIDNGVVIINPTPVQRYQLSNNIELAALELDEASNIISYEEYYPYGETSYRAGRNVAEVSQKRYRYTGKEKDEESGLYYYGARYYAPWLGRWTAADPAGLVDGLNLYMYCRGSPVGLVDEEGMEAKEFWIETDEDGMQSIYAQRGEAFGWFDGGQAGEIKNSDISTENISEDTFIIAQDYATKDVLNALENSQYFVEEDKPIYTKKHIELNYEVDSQFIISPMWQYVENVTQNDNSLVPNPSERIHSRAGKEPDFSWHRPRNDGGEAAYDIYRNVRNENIINQNSLERDMWRWHEQDEKEKARRKRQEENKLREEERIRKMKDSWFFKIQKNSVEKKKIF